MSTHFSIGEFSKLHNISIQTLRYYDRIGLLKPAIVKEDSNYRYYTINQFVKVDLIKNFKSMGLDLESIKKILGSEISNEDLLKVIANQKNEIDKKIHELEEQKAYMSHLEKNISEFNEFREEEILIVENEERYLYKYNCICRNIEELEFNLRNIILDMENSNKYKALEFVFITDKQALFEKRIQHNAILLNISKQNKDINIDKVTLESGRYLTMYFNDRYENSFRYYEKLLGYIEENNIKINGEFYETCILAKIDDEGEEKSLVRIEVLVE